MGVPQQRGAAAETLAAAFLELNGWTIEARNTRIAGVEIDLVVVRDRTRALVEVKCRGRTDYGGAALAVDRAKRERLRRAARCLAGRDAFATRIDVVAIEWNEDGAAVRRYPNAVQEGA